MGKMDWSAGQLGRDLPASFSLPGRREHGGALAPGESAALADGGMRPDGALPKVSESLGAQASLRRYLAALRARSLPSEDALRHSPPEEFLSRPPVVPSAQGGVLGVSRVSGRPLRMGGFVRLAGQGGDTRRSVCPLWEERGADRFLTMGLCGQGAARRSCCVLEARAVLTPGGSHVTEPVGPVEAGVAVSEDLLLHMFRPLRETLKEQ